MSLFNIDPSEPLNQQNDNAYYNRFTALQPTGSIPENHPNIRYNKSLFDQNKNSSTYNTNNTQNNNARSVIADWTARAVRNFKYNILLDRFSPGYPENYTYNFCDQKLSSVFSLGSNRHVSVDQSVSTNYPKNHSISIVQDNTNNSFLCAAPPTNNCQNTVCLPGQIFDPVTCLCTTPEECVPQDGCEPTVVYSNIKPKIYGYAFYLERVKEVNIPDIGNVKASCGGGHVCCSTLFRPILVFSNNSTLSANRNICMDNFPSCANDGSQIPVPGFIGQQYERSDIFEFTLDNPSSLSDARLELTCEYRGCHSGVTFVVLVGETVDTNTKVVLFSSCVAPGSVNSKVIGTIDCDNEPVPCEPPITPTPPLTPTPLATSTPTPTPAVSPTPTPTPTVVSCTECLEPYVFLLPGGGSGQTEFETTITVPSQFSLPVLVSIVGGVDDVLLKDGSPWPSGSDPNESAHGYNHTWLENNRTFTLAAKDTRGGNIGWNATICFIKNTSACRCPDKNIAYFRGFLDPNTWYRSMYLYDEDTCTMWGYNPDGRIKITAVDPTDPSAPVDQGDLCGLFKVVDGTNYYISVNPSGTYVRRGFGTSLNELWNPPAVGGPWIPISNTLLVNDSGPSDPCGNFGDKIKFVLSDPV